MNSRGFVIGNGTSRKNFDLETLRGHGIIGGCNYIYNDFEPDILITLDKSMNEEIQELVDYGWPRKWRWFSRKHFQTKRTEKWYLYITEENKPLCVASDINEGYNNNSGLMAAGILTEVCGVTELYLIGIDFWSQVPEKQNDLYSQVGYRSKWLAPCWNRLSANNPQTTFYRVGSIDIDISFFEKELVGYNYVSFEEFEKNHLNNQR